MPKMDQGCNTAARLVPGTDWLLIENGGSLPAGKLE
jgi:hypothetical protein